MTRYSNTGIKILNMNIEYEHIGTNLYTIFVMNDKGKQQIELYWQLAPIRNNNINRDDILECLRYYIDIEDLEGTKHYKKANIISNKLLDIFGIMFYDELV